MSKTPALDYAVITLIHTRTRLQKIWHYLFQCPTFWRWKPRFTCPDCGATYRCYWDGHDAGGKINLCNDCVRNYPE